MVTFDWKRLVLLILLIQAILLCACGSSTENYTSVHNGGHVSLSAGGRTYVPFCVVSKNDCGRRLGFVDGDKGDVVCRYKDLPENEWIANYLTVDGGAMLLKEEEVTTIPEGLSPDPDYWWAAE